MALFKSMDERAVGNELVKRDKLNLDIFWLKDASLDDADSLPTAGRDRLGRT